MFNPEKVQALAARRLTEQQIADVLNIDLEELRKDRVSLSRYREAIRKGGITRGGRNSFCSLSTCPEG